MRRPKLKVKLPSKGNFWSEGSIKYSETNEYDVYSLTARDSLALRNPTAIAGSQPVIGVIQSCVPAIKDASAAPSMDIDALLIAIRIASLGNVVKAKATVGEKTFDCVANLDDVINQINNFPDWDGSFKIDDEITIYLRPVPFSTVSAMGMEAVETQRIMNIINDDQAAEEKKIEVFKKSFSKLTNLTMGFVQQCVYRIDVGEETVTNPAFIKEFLENCDSDIFTKIRNRIDELSEIYSIKPVKVAATEEMIAAGSEKEVDAFIEYDIPVFFLGDDE